MSEKPKPDNGKAEREARLAQALRTNLRRRKLAPAPAAKAIPVEDRDGD